MPSEMAPRRLLLSVVSAWVVLCAPATAAAATGTTSDPSANRTLSQATLVACQGDAGSTACVTAALADINAARTGEGVVPMVLPSDFTTLNGAEQLLVLADLERVGRGLLPALGLASSLNADAASAAADDADPVPAHFYGDAYASNWAGGFPSTLEADFVWMYDDGPGAGNLDCTAAGQPGCWGHRHNILMSFDAPLVMGAAVGTGAYGTSTAELFVGGDGQAGSGQPDAPVAPLWSAIAAQLPGAAPGGDPSNPSAGSAGTGTSGTNTSSASRPSTSRPRTRRTQIRARLALTARVITSRAAAVAGRRIVAIRGRVIPGQAGLRVVVEARMKHDWRAVASARLGVRSRFGLRLGVNRRGPTRLRIVLMQPRPVVLRYLTLRVG